MKKLLAATAMSVALYAGLSSPSTAEQTPTSGSGASVDTIVADLERRIEQLEAKVGGGTADSAFQARGAKVRHLTVPAKASD